MDLEIVSGQCIMNGERTGKVGAGCQAGAAEERSAAYSNWRNGLPAADGPLRPRKFPVSFEWKWN